MVILGFAGLQSLDVVGPSEVFAGADRVLDLLGRAGGYTVALASADGRPVTAASGVALCTVPRPDLSERIDTLIIPGGEGVHAAAAVRHGLPGWTRRRAGAGGWPPCAPGPSSWPRRGSWTVVG